MTETETETRRIRHTLDKGAPVNLTGSVYLAFPASGVLELDADRAAELVETHPLVEYASEIPDDYSILRKMAAAANADAVDGNSAKSAIRGYLETLSEEELEDLRP